MSPAHKPPYNLFGLSRIFRFQQHNNKAVAILFGHMLVMYQKIFFSIYDETCVQNFKCLHMPKIHFLSVTLWRHSNRPMRCRENSTYVILGGSNFWGYLDAHGISQNASCIFHYNDVIMGAMQLKSPASPLFTQPFIQTQVKRNIKAPRHWPLCGEFTGNRWIPRTNGQ